MPKQVKTCEHCGAEFSTGHKDARFCSSLCSYRTWYKRSGRQRPTQLKMCPHCNKEFQTTRSRARFCSLDCQKLARKAAAPESRYPALPSGTVGTIGELIVATD